MKSSKRVIALLLCVVMALALTACGGTEDKDDNGTSTEAKNSNFKVGVIHIGDPADGFGYSYAHDQGIVAMQNELKFADNQIIRKNNVADQDAAAVKTAITECIEEGCNVIFGTSWGYMDTMEEMAREYPEVMFSHCSGYKSNGTNFNNYFGRIYQARYLTGIAAGLKTKSNKIGYVAAMDSSNSEVTGGINAFALGVQSVNKEAKVYVKVTNTWNDTTLEGQAADALLDQGCDVLTQHQDSTATLLAAEKRSAFGCGYNSDMTKDAPKAHLTAAIWNWGVYYTKTVKAIMENSWTCENYFGGMDEDFVGLSTLSENCAAGTQEAIDKAKAKILDGTNKIFQGELKDNKGNIVCKKGEVLSDSDITGKMKWYYENVVAK